MKLEKQQIAFILILLATILIRLIITFTKYHTINSDNAIIGLMARHILKGELPVFFYGQPYMGSLEAFIIAIFFFFLGISINTMVVAMVFITTLGIISAYFLGKEVKDKTLGLYTMLIATLPPLYIFWHGLAAFGGYPEMLLFGNILLTLSLKVIKITNHRQKIKYYIILGFIAGLAFWTHLLILYYLIPVALYLLINENKKFLFLKAPILVIPTFILGSLPLWIYNLKYNFGTFTFPQAPHTIERIKYFLETIPLLISSELLRATDLFHVLIFIYIASFIVFIICRGKVKFLKSPQFLFLLYLANIIYFFSASHIAFTRCPRYAIPAFTLIMISVAYLSYYLNRKIRHLGSIVLVFVLLFNGFDIYESYIIDKQESYYDRKLFEELIGFLEKNNLCTNYCVFQISEKLNLLSDEKIINASYGGERYLPYEKILEESDNIAFIAENRHLEPIYNMLCENFTRSQIGPFNIYYNFQPKKYSGKLMPPGDWKAASNYNTKDISFTFDRNMDTHWSTITPKRKKMFYELDLGRKCKIYKIAFFNYVHWRNFPYDLILEVSLNGKDWKKVNIPSNSAPLFFSGPRIYCHLEDGRIELLFEPLECRYIKITQNGEHAIDSWDLNEIFVWEYTGDRFIDLGESKEIYSFISANNIKNVYTDFWLSAKISQLSNDKIRTLKPENKQHPYKKDTSRFIELDKGTAFVIDNENILAFEKIISLFGLNMETKRFKNYTCFYLTYRPGIHEILFWSGYGLLKTNRFIPPLPEDISIIKKENIFKNNIKFLGYNSTVSGQTLKMDYFWQVEKIPRYIFVFAHFTKEDEIIFQNDHPLLAQFSLTTPPKNKEIFRESYIIKDIPPGTYNITMGLWNPWDEERIKTVYPEKKKSAIQLGTVTMENHNN